MVESSFEPDNTAKAVHDGMKVFEAWGSEVREFAMAFEVPDGKRSISPIYVWVTTVSLN